MLQTKTNLATMASGEVKMATKYYTRWLNCLLKRTYLSLLEKMLPEQRLAICFGTFFLKNVVLLKVKFCHFVQLVAPTDQWLATFYISNYSTAVNFKKKGEVWRQI